MALTDMTFKDYTAETFKKYYATLLSFACSHPEWGVLIKPKHHRIWEQIDSRINDLIKQLDFEKRLVITKVRLSPAVLSYAADICIGLWINSAAVIAGVKGVLSLCWDASGCPGHPLYKSKNSIIVFESLSEIIRVLDNFSPKVCTALLNEEKESILNDVDSFRDNKGPIRIGSWISNYMFLINSGLSNDTALKKASLDYGDTYGHSNVLELEKNKSLNNMIENSWQLPYSI